MLPDPQIKVLLPLDSGVSGWLLCKYPLPRISIGENSNSIVLGHIFIIVNQRNSTALQPGAPSNILIGLRSLERRAHSVISDQNPRKRDCEATTTLRLRSKLRILDVLETLHATLHLLCSLVVASFGVFVNIQLPLVVAHVFALHDVLSENSDDALSMLEGFTGFGCPRLEIAASIEGVAGEFS